jgi:predicted metalloprotease with PDZ domain
MSVAMLWAASVVACAIELPAGPLLNLKAEAFSKRESAQAELQRWASGQGAPALDALYRHSREAGDPEVRDRCLAVLRELVIQEYLQQGEGYLGIRMLDEFAHIPGDPERRSVIRVIQVVPDSAAQQAGLQANDLIVALGDEIWHKGMASKAFTEKIRQLKPKAKITLKVMREGKLMGMDLTLGRRPLLADPMWFDPSPEDLEAAENMAKDAYFRRWLHGRKARN